MSTTVTEQEARRIQRFELSLPTRVEVKVDGKFSWNEITRMEDVSSFGAGFILNRPVKRGRVLHLSARAQGSQVLRFLEPHKRSGGWSEMHHVR